MLGDRNPSVVCGLFTTQKGYKEFIDRVDNCKGMRVREIKFVDISIPLDENFDDNLNFLKGGSMCMLKRIATAELPFGIKDKLFNKMGLKPFDYSKQWKHDNKHPFLFSGLTPLAVDLKYTDDEESYSKEEKEKAKRLLTWETPNYEPRETGVFEE